MFNQPSSPSQIPSASPPQEIHQVSNELKPGSNFKSIFVLLILFAGGIIVGFYLGRNQLDLFQPKVKACTLEAKLCSDGSSVGRTGPNCEFSPCPTITSVPKVTKNWNFLQDVNGINYCKKTDGKWLTDYNECETLISLGPKIQQEQLCKSAGGKFNSCMSPCRHDPNAKYCDESCAVVCSF